MFRFILKQKLFVRPISKYSQQLNFFRSVKGRLAITGVVFSTTALFGLHLETRERFENETKEKLMKRVGLGGKWTLTDHDGKQRNNSDFFGSWLLMYFGYCNCPDVCPDEMEKLAAVYTKLGEEHPKYPVLPMYITIDPVRDTLEVIRRYVREFHPQILGFSGTEEELKVAKKAYGVYSAANPSEFDDYIVDHTIIIYLIDPEGNYIEHYGSTMTEEEIYGSVLNQIKDYNREKQPSYWLIRKLELSAEVIGDCLASVKNLILRTSTEEKVVDKDLAFDRERLQDINLPKTDPLGNQK